jgi:hypothetical protein
VGVIRHRGGGERRAALAPFVHHQDPIAELHARRPSLRGTHDRGIDRRIRTCDEHADIVVLLDESAQDRGSAAGHGVSARHARAFGRMRSMYAAAMNLQEARSGSLQAHGVQVRVSTFERRA